MVKSDFLFKIDSISKKIKNASDLSILFLGDFNLKFKFGTDDFENRLRSNQNRIDTMIFLLASIRADLKSMHDYFEIKTDNQ